ncbi:MAG TPA: hypothetical protein VGP42_13520 [Stellaceae bacterium]|jgi:hypothetical protein|nr:hypothetical protein [Stellaceae bacterium]
MNLSLLPASVSTVLAGRLLGFVPPSAFAAYRTAHPGEFPNSTARRIALIDIEAHPRRAGRAVPVKELLAADRAEDANRERYRHYNSTRKEAGQHAST